MAVDHGCPWIQLWEQGGAVAGGQQVSWSRFGAQGCKRYLRAGFPWTGLVVAVLGNIDAPCSFGRGELNLVSSCYSCVPLHP